MGTQGVTNTNAKYGLWLGPAKHKPMHQSQTDHLSTWPDCFSSFCSAVHSTSHFSLEIINFPYGTICHWKCEIFPPETAPMGSEEACSKQPVGGMAMWMVVTRLPTGSRKCCRLGGLSEQ